MRQANEYSTASPSYVYNDGKTDDDDVQIIDDDDQNDDDDDQNDDDVDQNDDDGDDITMRQIFLRQTARKSTNPWPRQIVNKLPIKLAKYV